MSAPGSSDPDFLDSNVLIYAYDPTDSRKQAIGRALLNRALAQGSAISTQVLVEFVATILHKLRPAARPEQVLQALDAVSPLRVIRPDAELVRRAVQAHTQYGIHFYDGMIVAAAERAGCQVIWSEDLNPGQTYFGVRVENPFC